MVVTIRQSEHACRSNSMPKTIVIFEQHEAAYPLSGNQVRHWPDSASIDASVPALIARAGFPHRSHKPECSVKARRASVTVSPSKCWPDLHSQKRLQQYVALPGGELVFDVSPKAERAGHSPVQKQAVAVRPSPSTQQSPELPSPASCVSASPCYPMFSFCSSGKFISATVHTEALHRCLSVPFSRAQRPGPEMTDYITPRVPPRRGS